MKWNTDFFETGSCNIRYRGEHVGVTLNSPLLNAEPEFYEAQCDHNGVSKVIMNMKMSVAVEVKEIDNAFANDVPAAGGVLCLSPVCKGSRISCCFPKAVLVPGAKNTKEHYIKINFEVFEDSEGVLIKKILK